MNEHIAVANTLIYNAPGGRKVALRPTGVAVLGPLSLARDDNCRMNPERER